MNTSLRQWHLRANCRRSFQPPSVQQVCLSSLNYTYMYVLNQHMGNARSHRFLNSIFLKVDTANIESNSSHSLSTLGAIRCQAVACSPPSCLLGLDHTTHTSKQPCEFFTFQQHCGFKRDRFHSPSFVKFRNSWHWSFSQHRGTIVLEISNFPIGTLSVLKTITEK